jgi:mannose-6-phosphate isomerase-like protein (cupin superfamily)
VFGAVAAPQPDADYSRHVELRNPQRDATPFVTKDGSTIREYFHSERQSLAEASLEPRQTTQRHYHERSEEIYLIVEGGGELEVDGDRREVAAGDAVLIPPSAWHELTAGGDGVRLLCCCVPPYSDADTYFA